MLTISDRLTKARMDVILFAPFYGALLMRLPMVRNDGVETLCTNGKVIEYAEPYVQTLSDSDLRGVLAHEVAHCALGHLWRMGDRDGKKWNMATDYAVNAMLDTYVAEDREAFHLRNGSGRSYLEPWTLPKGLLREPAFDGLPSEEIYARLPDGDSSDGGKGDQNLRNPQAYQSPGEFSHPPKPDNQPDAEGEPIASENGASEEEWTMAVVQAATAAKQRGQLPASLARFVKDLVKPKVSWREVLREFLRRLSTDDYSWVRPNRRYLQAGIIQPSLHSHRLGRIAIAVDNSGSIDDKMLAEFQAEIQAVLDECSPEAIEVIYCDAAIQKIQEFTPGDAVRLESSGGGSTDFRPVFEHLDGAEEPPVALVYLTDGYGSFPEREPEYPVLWASTAVERFPFGRSMVLKLIEEGIP